MNQAFGASIPQLREFIVALLTHSYDILFQPVVNGVEAEEERAFALREDPLRFEIFCRNSEDEPKVCTVALRSYGYDVPFRPVIGGVVAVEERVFALRKDPLRFATFCRNSEDEMTKSAP